MADIIPDSHSNRLDFFKNLKQQITDNAAALGLDAAEVAAANAILDPLIASYQALVDAEEAAVTTSADADQVFSAQNDPLRALFNQFKNTSKFTDGMGEAMRIFTKSTQRNPAETKPKIKASPQPGGIVRITGSKDYADLINIYMRRTGESQWMLIGIRRKKFPLTTRPRRRLPVRPSSANTWRAASSTTRKPASKATW